MQPYITFREDGPEGTNQHYYVLQRAFPHFIGRIDTQISDNRMISPIPITGHSMWLSFAGTIQGNMIPSYHNIDKELVSVLSDMATWFYAQRISTNPNRYKKWKLPPLSDHLKNGT